MNNKNIILILLLLFTALVFFMCAGGGETTNNTGSDASVITSTGLTAEENILEYGIPAQLISFEYPVPDGMIEDPAMQEEMIQAKIENLEKSNDIYWGELPGEIDDLLIMFQDIWGFISSYFPGFKGLGLDWDEIGDEYYYEIEEGLESYGEFAQILTDMSFMLQEGHSLVIPGRFQGESASIPNLYLNKAPVIIPQNLSRIGACYTVTRDEEMVVSKVWEDSPNPYNLQIGDEIVGFNGVPWEKWINKLLDADIPIYGSPASAPSAIRYNLLRSGMANIYLFEKVNIKKADSGEIITLPVQYLDPTKDPTRSSIITCTELPYDTPGIDWKGEKTGEGYEYETYTVPGETRPTIIYGKLKDTNIGYIFLLAFPSGFEEFEDTALWDPYKTEFSAAFEKAVLSLMDTDGIILDLRNNTGGRNETAYKGFAKLIDSEKEIKIFVDLERDTESTDREKLIEVDGSSHYSLMPDEGNTHYDNPIVVMTGPDCISACDYTVAFLSKFDEFTIIGRDTNASFTGVAPMRTYEVESDYVLRYIPQLTSAYIETPTKPLLRSTGFIDEYVWFEKEYILKDTDSMRLRAIEIIENAKAGE
jgi:hypothetical protein